MEEERGEEGGGVEGSVDEVVEVPVFCVNL